MKKLIFILSLLFIAVNFVSCNDDDDDPKSIDKIVGKWQLDQEFLNNEELPLDACDKMSVIEIFENNTYTEKDFIYDDEQLNCIPFDTVTGTWEHVGGSTYKISDISSVPGVEIAIEVKVVFQNNKMIIEFSETIDGETISLKFIFIKVID